MAEKRRDPEDGAAYTLDEISAFYKGKYNKKAIAAYWEECVPVRQAKGTSKGKGGKAEAAPKAKAKAKAKAEWKAKDRAKVAPPEFLKGAGASVWLSPSGEDLAKLQELLDQAAGHLGTASFFPHVTLITGIPLEGGEKRFKDVLFGALRVAREGKPLEIILRSVAGFDQWNQCLLVTTELGDDLAAANVKAQMYIKPGAEPPSGPAFATPVCEPHLSVAYTDFASEADRESAVAWVRKAAPWVEGFKFTARSVSVWDTRGGLQDVPTWHKLADFPFGEV